tara:strand:- start:34139 stop:34507 length:369 start_codon:yes stop_codon:yes gene_type:complete
MLSEFLGNRRFGLPWLFCPSDFPAGPSRHFPKSGCHLPRDGSVVISVRKYVKETNMASGTVKWFNAQKGYGFIQPSDGGRDVFVHISAVERAGMSTLNEGQNINYELVTEKGKTSAANLTVA